MIRKTGCDHADSIHRTLLLFTPVLCLLFLSIFIHTTTTCFHVWARPDPTTLAWFPTSDKRTVISCGPEGQVSGNGGAGSHGSERPTLRPLNCFLRCGGDPVGQRRLKAKIGTVLPSAFLFCCTLAPAHPYEPFPFPDSADLAMFYPTIRNPEASPC